MTKKKSSENEENNYRLFPQQDKQQTMIMQIVKERERSVSQ